jgi:cellulose synthase/poly-beta-1,6-N-acetylglucosamine synthase-like glycosyltransferase
MISLPNILLWSLLACWVLQAIIGVAQNRKLMRRLIIKERPTRERFRPPTTVIMPIKGIDHDLPGCVRGLCTQDYPDYRVVIVLESQDDPAVPILRQELASYPGRDARIMIAGRADPDEGQKVHNQLHVLRELLPGMEDKHAIAFADSDAIPGPRWLGEMVGRLSTRVAVATGYRWMIPDPDRPASFWSLLASVINGSVACTYRPSDSDQAWGGAMAMLAATARQGELIRRLTGALTDDYPVTGMAKDLGRIVRFMPHCLAATPVDFDLRSFWTFARRQYLITRIYSPLIYWAAATVLTLWVTGFTAAWVHLLVNLAQGNEGTWHPSAAAIAIVFVCNHLRSYYRAAVVRAAFGPDMLRHLRIPLRMDRWLTPLWMLIHWLIALSALSSNRFTWRGIRYHLTGPHTVRRLD